MIRRCRSYLSSLNVILGVSTILLDNISVLGDGACLTRLVYTDIVFLFFSLHPFGASPFYVHELKCDETTPEAPGIGVNYDTE